MKKLIYILFYIALIWYEVLAMNNIFLWSIKESGGGASFLLLMWLLVSGFLFVLLSNKKNLRLSSFGKSFVFFYVYLFLISVIHGLLNGFERKVAAFEYVLPLICFFVEYCAQYDFGFNKLRRFLISLCFVVLSVNYYNNYEVVAIVKESALVGTNMSYFILYFVPILCIVTNQKYHKYIFVLVTIMVLASSKRGETISLLLGLLVYFYIQIGQSSKQGKFAFGRFFHILMLSVFIVIMFLFINSIFDEIVLNRLLNVTNDRGSGRLDIFDNTVALIATSDTIGHFFGHGYNAVKFKMIISAHNDFLEIIYDFGWICLLFFVVFIGKGLAFTFKHPDLNIRPIIGLSFSFFIVCSLISIITVRVYYLNLFALFWGAASGIPKYYSSIIQKEDTTTESF